LNHLESLVVEKLEAVFPGLSVRGAGTLPSGAEIDLFGTVGEKEYFVEIKKSECNRVVLGEIIDHYAELSKVYPKADLIVLCTKVNDEVRDALRKLGVEILTFQDLGIAPSSAMKNRHESSVINLSPLEQTAYFSLLRKGTNVVRTRDFADLLGKSHAYARNMIAALSKKGVLHRIGRGKYVVIPAEVLYQRKGHIGDPLILMEQIMQDEKYYVGYQSAAHFHGIAHQIPFDTVVAVLKQRRTIRLGSTRIRFIKVNEKKFFGFSELRYSETFVQVSDVEKTILDCLDRYDICGGISETTRTISAAVEKTDWDKLVEDLIRMKNKALAQRLGVILEKLLKRKVSRVPENVLGRIERLVGPYTYLLDVRSPGKGKTSRRWRIVENTDYMSW